MLALASVANPHAQPQTAGEGTEPLDWLYQTPADGAVETEQVEQVGFREHQLVCVSIGSILVAKQLSCIKPHVGVYAS